MKFVLLGRFLRDILSKGNRITGRKLQKILDRLILFLIKLIWLVFSLLFSVFMLISTFAEPPHPFPNFWLIFVNFFLKFFLTNILDMISNAILIKQYVFHQYLSHHLKDFTPPLTNIPPPPHLESPDTSITFYPIFLLCLCQADIFTPSSTQKQPTFTKI